LVPHQSSAKPSGMTAHLAIGCPVAQKNNHTPTDSRAYFPPFKTGRMNISNNCCSGFELPNGRQVNLSFWW